MFSHIRRLQYTLRVSECNPGLGNLILDQFGDAQGKWFATWRYFTQAITKTIPATSTCSLTLRRRI